MTQSTSTSDSRSGKGQREQGKLAPATGAAAAEGTGTAIRLGECILLTIVAVGLGLRFSPSDPLLQNSDFPWMGLLPLLCGLQHGFVAALFSASVLALAIIMPQIATVDSGPSWLLGCFAMGLVAGQFRDRFAERLSRAEREARQRGAMLASIQRQFELLQHSHEDLRAFHAGAHLSLQEATDATVQLIRAASSAPEAVAHLLELFAVHGRVDGCSLFLVRDGEVMLEPSGKLGNTPDGISEDDIIHLALREHRLVSIDRGERPVADEYPVLAAIPLVIPGGDVLAILAIHDMPLIAFEPQHLRRLLTIAGCLAEPLQRCLAGHQPAPQRSDKIEIRLLAKRNPSGHTSGGDSKGRSKSSSDGDRGQKAQSSRAKGNQANQALMG